MTQRQFPLKTLQERAVALQDDAGRQVALAQARLVEAQRKGELLESYRSQYQQRLQEAGAAGTTIRNVQDLSAFIARIDEALRQQRGEIEYLQALWDTARAQWLDRRSDREALDVLEERYAQREEQRARRLEQRAQDETASRRAPDA